MRSLYQLAFILTVIGGLNWGLVGLFEFNLVNALLGTIPVLERLVYILVGLSAAYLLVARRDNPLK